MRVTDILLIFVADKKTRAMGFLILFLIALTYMIVLAGSHDWRREDVDVLKQKNEAMRQRIRMEKEYRRKQDVKFKYAMYGPRKFRRLVEEGKIEMKPGDLD